MIAIKCVVLSLKLNSGHEAAIARRVFLSTLVVHVVLWFGDDRFSGLYRKCSKKKRKN